MYLSMAVWYCVSDEFLGIGVIAQMEAFSSGENKITSLSSEFAMQTSGVTNKVSDG